MSKYNAVLLDIDDTILDFQQNEHESLAKVFAFYGIPFTEDNIHLYQGINRKLWSQYEQGEIEREQIFRNRYQSFFDELGIEADGVEADARYRQYLDEGHQIMPHSQWLLRQLATKGYKVYAATNGVKTTQYRRLTDADYLKYFDKLFISEELGFQKPDGRFFDSIFQADNQLDMKRTLMVGDSLFSDIRGGATYGLDTAWFNWKEQPASPDIQPTYVINDLYDLAPILDLDIQA